MTKVLEGTWAEIRAQQPDWENKRLRVEVLELPSEPQGNDANASVVASSGEDDFSLAERLRRRVGRVAFEPTDLAARSEEYYAQLMDEKYLDGTSAADKSS